MFGKSSLLSLCFFTLFAAATEAPTPDISGSPEPPSPKTAPKTPAKTAGPSRAQAARLAKQAETARQTQTDAIVAKVQKAWDELTSYKSEFIQKVNSKTLGTEEETRGVLYVQKPNRLRWESVTDGTTQILNGKKFTSLRKNRRRGTTTVDIYEDASKSMDTRALQFLSGRVRFQELYNADILIDEDNRLEIRFRPKGEISESYVAEIDKGSYFLTALTTDSMESRVRMVFVETKRNPSLEEALFVYKPGSKDIVHTHN